MLLSLFPTNGFQTYLLQEFLEILKGYIMQYTTCKIL